jgi:hypothetical protein
MVGMISLRGSDFPMGTNRSNDEETSLKLFSGADPINFPDVVVLLRLNVSRPLWGRRR